MFDYKEYLPKVKTPETDPEWAACHIEEWDSVPDVAWVAEHSSFFMNFYGADLNGGFEYAQEEYLDVPSVTLREIAAIMLAAADYQDNLLKQIKKR